MKSWPLKRRAQVDTLSVLDCKKSYNMVKAEVTRTRLLTVRKSSFLDTQYNETTACEGIIIQDN